MLNAIWAVMIMIAVFYGAFTGRMSDVTNAALDSAGEAISLCITMAGVVGLWMGIMEIATKAGLVKKLTRGIDSCFPGSPGIIRQTNISLPISLPIFWGLAGRVRRRG